MAEPGALRDDGAAVQIDERLGNREAEPEPAEGLRDGAAALLERIENPRQRLGRDADAGIGHADLKRRRAVVRHHPRGDGDAAAFRGELERVLQQVPEDLRQPRGIGADDHRAAREVALPRQLFAAEVAFARGLQRVLEQRREVDALQPQLQLAARDAGEVEQVVDEPRLERDVAIDEVEIRAQIRRQPRVVAHGGDEREHRRERRAQLVRERREEVVLRAARRLGFLQPALLGDLRKDALQRGGDELDEVRRLRNEVAHAGAHRFQDARLIGKTGDENGREIAPFALQLPIEIEPVLRAGKLVIEHEQIDLRLRDVLARFRKIAGREHRIPLALQGPPHQVADAGIVLEEQHVPPRIGRSAHEFQPLRGRLTICKKRPSRRIASMKLSYSTGLVM